jgi:hypothetical protein
VRNTFWLKSHRYLMTLNFSACANYSKRSSAALLMLA